MPLRSRERKRYSSRVRRLPWRPCDHASRYALLRATERAAQPSRPDGRAGWELPSHRPDRTRLHCATLTSTCSRHRRRASFRRARSSWSKPRIRASKSRSKPSQVASGNQRRPMLHYFTSLTPRRRRRDDGRIRLTRRPDRAGRFGSSASSGINLSTLFVNAGQHALRAANLLAFLNPRIRITPTTTNKETYATATSTP